MLNMLEDEETTIDSGSQSKMLSSMLHRAQIDLPPPKNPSYKQHNVQYITSITTSSLTLNRSGHKKIAEAPGAPESPRKRTTAALPQEINVGFQFPKVASPPVVPESLCETTSRIWCISIILLLLFNIFF